MGGTPSGREGQGKAEVKRQNAKGKRSDAGLLPFAFCLLTSPYGLGSAGGGSIGSLGGGSIGSPSISIPSREALQRVQSLQSTWSAQMHWSLQMHWSAVTPLSAQRHWLLQLTGSLQSTA